MGQKLPLGEGGLGVLPQGYFEPQRLWTHLYAPIYGENTFYLAYAKKKNTDDNSKYIKNITESMLLRAIGHL